MKNRSFVIWAALALVATLTVRAIFGAATPSANYVYGTDSANAAGYQLPGLVVLRFTAASISAGGTGDLQTQATGLLRYIVKDIYVEATAASGTLALATIDIRTATAGGGSSVLAAPTALASLTAADLAMAVNPMAVGAVQTAANLTLRQTVLSANAGTISVVMTLTPVP